MTMWRSCFACLVLLVFAIARSFASQTSTRGLQDLVTAFETPTLESRREIAIARKNRQKEVALSNKKECVKWGDQFAVPLDGKNIVMSCTSPGGRPVCCAAASESENENKGTSQSQQSYRGVGYGIEDDADAVVAAQNELDTLSSSSSSKRTCKVNKIYISSPQELRDLHVAQRISKIGATELAAFLENGNSKDEVDSGTRLPLHVHSSRMNALLAYVTSAETVNNSTIWLNRVKEHMRSEQVPVATKDDFEYLSRFEFTKVCYDNEHEAHDGSGTGTGNVVAKWIEWIEPLSITARHPFGFGHCRPAANAYALSSPAAPRRPRSDVDYVLLQSGKQLFQQESIIRTSASASSKSKTTTTTTTTTTAVVSRPQKHFLLDAGTSTFDSSLYWFTCAFSQRKVSFDNVYAWEMTILNPVEYWQKVPPKWLPYWHFYNSPISAVQEDHMSPVRILKSIAVQSDFVAFKLDIDHSSTEMPIAMSLLKDKKFSSLIDEFFFELHFRCEIMTSCGWGKRVPFQLEDLKLERADVLAYFIQLRSMGIRAHIWP